MSLNQRLLTKFNIDKDLPWMTNGAFSLMGTYRNITQMKLDDLYQAACLIESLAIGHKTLPSSLEVPSEFLFSGYPYHAWMSDIRKRIAILRLAEAD